GNRDRLSSVGGSEFFHNMFDVNLNCFLGDKEGRGDVAVAVTLCYQLQNLDLAFCEVLVAEVLRQLSGDLGRYVFFAGVDLADNVDQFFGRHVFEHISAGSGLQSPVDLDVTFECGQHNNTGIRKFFENRDHRVDTAHVG